MNIESISNHNFFSGRKKTLLNFNQIRFIFVWIGATSPSIGKKRNHSFPTVFKLKFIKKKISVSYTIKWTTTTTKKFHSVKWFTQEEKKKLNKLEHKAQVTRWPMNHMGTNNNNNNNAKLWMFFFGKFLVKIVKTLASTITEKKQG